MEVRWANHSQDFSKSSPNRPSPRITFHAAITMMVADQGCEGVVQVTRLRWSHPGHTEGSEMRRHAV
jgi:hypothetical protein